MSSKRPWNSCFNSSNRYFTGYFRFENLTSGWKISIFSTILMMIIEISLFRWNKLKIIIFEKTSGFFSYFRFENVTSGLQIPIFHSIYIMIKKYLLFHWNKLKIIIFEKTSSFWATSGLKMLLPVYKFAFF